MTARQLLTHTAGLHLRAQLKNLYGTDPAGIRRGVLHETLNRPPGETVGYTDRAALILGYLAEHLSGQPLDVTPHSSGWQCGRPCHNVRCRPWGSEAGNSHPVCHRPRTSGQTRHQAPVTRTTRSPRLSRHSAGR